MCYQNGNISGETPGSNFQVSLDRVFQHAAERTAFTSRMEQTLQMSGANPNNLADVRAYMDQVSQQQGPDGVRRELNAFLTSFYTHGNSVNYHPTGSDWTRNEPQVGDIQSRTMQDGASRKVIDCDGYAALARDVLGGIDGGRYDFQWGYTSGPGGAHMLGGVMDTRSGQGFVVDNNQTGATYTRNPGETLDAAARRGMALSLNQFHQGQNITANGLGVGTTYTAATTSPTQPVLTPVATP
jgi:hypothetical protein